MKIDRLIGIITLLLQQDQMTAPELAARFGVSRRTINRDIEDICKAGIPLVTVQGFGGGISIAEGYKIDKSVFTEDELQTIFSGLKGLDSVSQTSYLTTLTDKLSDKNKPMVVQDYILIDLASHYQGTLTPKIELIKQAIQNRKVLSFRYYYNKGEDWRTIEPYRLVFRWSSWYVFGYCLDRNAYRLFKLHRLWDLQCTEMYFAERTIPEDELDFERHFSSEGIRLKAEFCESEKYRLIEEYGVECYSVAEGGKLLFECDFIDYDNMREWIFSFGDKVRVLGPEQLRIDRVEQAMNILKDV